MGDSKDPTSPFAPLDNKGWLDPMPRMDLSPGIDAKDAEITRLRAALSDAQVVGFAAGVEAAATLVATHAYTSGSNGMTLEPSEMARHDMHHHTIAKGIRALAPPDPAAAAARVLLDDLAKSHTDHLDAQDRWRRANDAMGGDLKPWLTYMDALRAIAGDTP